MPTTTNFGWTTPADTDLVKDGASAIRTLGNNIDTSLLDLKGGTTGQVLAKNSNTDLDFVWSSDQVGIPASIVDAKGDIIAATAADTVSRLAVGANDTVLTADSTAATGLKWAAINAGGMTLLSTTTCSGATTTVSSIAGTYTNLFVVVEGVTNATADGEFRVAINSSTGSIQSGTMGYKHGVGTFTVNGTSSGYLTLTNSTPDRASSKNVYSFTIYRYATADANKMIAHNATWTDTDPMFFLGTSDFYSTSAVSSLQFSNTGGNLTGGTIYVYGVK
jgi:hypothetical protein